MDLSVYKGKALVFTSQEEQVNNEMYTTLNSEIEIKKEMFHNIYPGFYPKKELTNQIGSAMGIEHVGEAKIEEVFGDMEQLTDGRSIRRVEGYRCTKRARRRRPDGSWQEAVEPYEFNWVNRAELDFLQDEEKSPNDRKYGTPLKKKLHLEELKKFAAQRASTGADLCLIRALTGMQTSFKPAEIAIGKIVVSQIVESERVQSAKIRAHIDNIRLGGISADNVNNAAMMLTGKSADTASNFNEVSGKESSSAKPENPPADPEPEVVEMTLQDEFEELVSSPELSAIRYDENMSAADFYRSTVSDNGGTDDVLSWAISEMKKRIGK